MAMQVRLAGYYHWHEQTTNLKTETYLTDATTTVSEMMSLMSGQKEITWCGTHINYVVLLLKMFHVNFTVWKLSNPLKDSPQNYWPDLTNVNAEEDKNGKTAWD